LIPERREKLRELIFSMGIKTPTVLPLRTSRLSRYLMKLLLLPANILMLLLSLLLNLLRHVKSLCNLLRAPELPPATTFIPPIQTARRIQIVIPLLLLILNSRAKPVLCSNPIMGDFIPSLEDLETGVQEMQEGCLSLTELTDSLPEEVQQSSNIQAPQEEEEEMKVEDFSVQDEEEGEEQEEREPTENQEKGHSLWVKASRKILAYGAIVHRHPTSPPLMPPPMLEEMNQKAKEGLGLGLAVRAGTNGNWEFATIPDKKGIYYYFVSPSMKKLKKNPLSSPLFAVTALIIGGLWEMIWLFLLTGPYAMLSKT
jgi:hypothetical protein